MASETQVELIKDVIGLIDDIGDEKLSDWQRSFFSDFRERFEKYGEKTYISEKQVIQLQKIRDLF